MLIKKIKNISMIRRFLQTQNGKIFATFIQNSFIYKAMQKSVGDVWYPFYVIKWKIASLLVRRKTVSIEGVRFTLPCNNWITHFRWYLFNIKEVEVRSFIDNHLKDGDVFFDIGANIGVFSIYAGKKYDNLRVYSFEPEYSNLALLKQNIIQNQLQDTVLPYSLAISDTVGLSHLYLQDIDEGAAAHTESTDAIEITDEGYKVVGAEGIFTVTLDYIVGELDVIPSCIKMDTDGNELKIIEGAKKTLANPQLHALVIEMPDEDKRDKCAAILSSFGFVPEWVHPELTRNEVWLRQGIK